MREKKNEFVFTIGFKKKDPEHVRVAKMLNEMDPKNQFIVNAVLCYVDSGYVNVRHGICSLYLYKLKISSPQCRLSKGLNH